MVAGGGLGRMRDMLGPSQEERRTETGACAAGDIVDRRYFFRTLNPHHPTPSSMGSRS